MFDIGKVFLVGINDRPFSSVSKVILLGFKLERFIVRYLEFTLTPSSTWNPPPLVEIKNGG